MRRVAASLLVVLEEAVPAAVLYPALVESRHVHTGELSKLGILEAQLQDYAMHRVLQILTVLVNQQTGRCNESEASAVLHVRREHDMPPATSKPQSINAEGMFWPEQKRDMPRSWRA